MVGYGTLKPAEVYKSERFITENGKLIFLFSHSQQIENGLKTKMSLG